MRSRGKEVCSRSLEPAFRAVVGLHSDFPSSFLGFPTAAVESRPPNLEVGERDLASPRKSASHRSFQRLRAALTVSSLHEVYPLKRKFLSCLCWAGLSGLLLSGALA